MTLYGPHTGQVLGSRTQEDTNSELGRKAASQDPSSGKSLQQSVGIITTDTQSFASRKPQSQLKR